MARGSVQGVSVSRAVRGIGERPGVCGGVGEDGGADAASSRSRARRRRGSERGAVVARRGVRRGAERRRRTTMGCGRLVSRGTRGVRGVHGGDSIGTERAVYHAIERRRDSSYRGTSRRGRRRVRDRARFQVRQSAHSRRYGEPAVEMCGQGVEDVLTPRSPSLRRRTARFGGKREAAGVSGGRGGGRATARRGTSRRANRASPPRHRP